MKIRNYILKNKFLSAGMFGILISSLVCLFVVFFNEKSTSMFVLFIVNTLLAFIVFAFGRKVVLGVETYSQYHYFLIMLVIAFITFRKSNNVWFYLDCSMLLASITLAFARFGCIQVGCCHGKIVSEKSIWRNINTRHFINQSNKSTQIYPTQLMEITLHIINASIILTLQYYEITPGTSFMITISNLALMRFILEWFRGDSGRPHWLGFYETQLISALLLGSISVLMLIDFLPINLYLIGTFLVLIAVSVIRIIIGKENIRSIELNQILEGFDQLKSVNSSQLMSINLKFGWKLAYTQNPFHLSFSNKKKNLKTSQILQIQEFLKIMGRIPKDNELTKSKNQSIFHLTQKVQS